MIIDNLMNMEFYGEVVDIDDPEKRGRARIKVYGKFDDLEDEDIPWAEQAMSGTFGASGASGCGISAQSGGPVSSAAAGGASEAVSGCGVGDAGGVGAGEGGDADTGAPEGASATRGPLSGAEAGAGGGCCGDVGEALATAPPARICSTNCPGSGIWER